MPVNSFEDYPMSWRPVLEDGGEPLYHRLARQLERDVSAGVLRPGTKLPPQRELADFLDINVSTVSRAFKLCAERGLLSGSVGSGTYITYDRPTDLLESAPGYSRVIELGSMVPETLPQTELTDLLQKMLAEDDGRFFQYSRGMPDWQRAAAVKLLTRAGCPASGEQILLAGGGQNALAAIFCGLLHPGDRMGVDPLVYPGVKSASKLFGVQLVPIPQRDGEMSADGLRYAARSEGIRAVYVMPECQNPTTHTMTAAGRDRLAAAAREWDLLILEDGIMNLLSDKPEESVFARAPERTVFILSLSKAVSPALRLAYLAVPADKRQAMDSALYGCNLSQSALLLELASRLAASGRLDALLERRRTGMQIRNQLADRILSGFLAPGGSFCLSRWLRLPPELSGQALEHLALERGVRVYGSERFAVGKEAPVHGARLAICAPDSLEELEQGLLLLRELLESV